MGCTRFTEIRLSELPSIADLFFPRSFYSPRLRNLSRGMAVHGGHLSSIMVNMAFQNDRKNLMNGFSDFIGFYYHPALTEELLRWEVYSSRIVMLKHSPILE
ncbi:hypothetical protein NPIL_689891 [Nephila pilipes]|uniref:Uncharacterized protein n=1 Tax=Nephila pilipes TaxID=299642 RepID=A0A8X6PFA6_NEPPI|nr:hypothetical protein NPIL_689891 [Nephila pilipes]